MSEEYLIRHGAPTLAGIKTGSLFTCPCQDQKTLVAAVRRLNQKLLPRGLRVIPLRFSRNKALIYLYRPRKLSADLSDAEAGEILRSMGYETGNCDRCLVQLARRLRCREEFPHEIGLFLGYPPEDVRGFIEHNSRDCKCVGCWKVYGDEAAARKKFAQYKECTRIYCDQWAGGTDIERLTVAG